ncbi:unnamed protein product [Wuchereria bancrofti]|nr:unnamed protein product [Wuchereria bancrofti]
MVKMFSAAVNMEKVTKDFLKIRPPQTCCPFRGTPTWATNPQKPPDYHFLAEKTYEAIKELEVKKLLPSPVAMTAEVKNPVPKGSKGKSKSRSKKKSDVEKNVPRNLKQ